MKTFFTTLPKNIARVFTGYNLLWQGIAMVLTAGIVLSGFDWWYFTHVFSAGRSTPLFTAVIVGGQMPIVAPLVLLGIGILKRSKKILTAGWAMGQAALVGLIISSFYKAFTGRIQPPHSTAIDISHEFNFGILKHGMFWGWPSSHTTVAFAMAFALVALYPNSKLIRYLAPLYALYIGIGVSMNIHWFSEFIAGIIFGTIIGVAVGNGFKKLV